MSQKIHLPLQDGESAPFLGNSLSRLHIYANSLHMMWQDGFPRCGNPIRREGIGLKGLPEERAVSLGLYMIENNATVRSAAKAFCISKSTVHMVVIKGNGL